MASALLAHRFFDRLARSADGVRAQLLEAYLQLGLNASSYELLAILSACGDAGSSQTELAEALRLSESNVCGLVDRLQSDGLLHRFRSRQDRRRSLLLLTQDGQQRVSETSALVESALLRWLDHTSDTELEQICHWLDRLSVRVAGNPLVQPAVLRVTSSCVASLKEAG